MEKEREFGASGVRQERDASAHTEADASSSGTAGQKPAAMTERPEVLQRIRLAHCADHRLAMVRFIRCPEVPFLMERWWAERDRAGGLKDFSEHIGRAQMWWVAEDMQILVEAATLSLPDFQLRPGDVPDPYGVVFYERPLAGVESESGQREYDGPLLLNAMSWNATSARRDGRGVLMAYSWVNFRSAPPGAPKNAVLGWKCIGVTTWDTGTGITEVREDYSEAHTASVIEDRKRLAALWLLAGQETICPRASEPVDRHAGKRHVRAGLEIPTTRVLRLRHRRPQREGEAAMEHRDWTHRWVVSGHWRNQWLPSEDRHRPTWIAPYVKGPEDKPLVLKETVKALVQ